MLIDFGFLAHTRVRNAVTAVFSEPKPPQKNAFHSFRPVATISGKWQVVKSDTCLIWKQRKAVCRKLGLEADLPGNWLDELGDSCL